jgi:hypothetical protein
MARWFAGVFPVLGLVLFVSGSPSALAQAGAVGARADARAAKAARDEAKAEKKRLREEAKAKRDAERAAAKEQKQADKAAKKAEIKAGKADDVEAKVEQRVDKRQDNQARRIQHGIKKGYLTPDEISKLEKQQKAIADMEASFKSDGKLTKDEAKSLRNALNEASRCIWAEKHDTEGGQMPTYRLGKNVFAKDELTAKMADENLSAAEAKALAKEFHHILALKKRLAKEDLTDEERAKLQAEYDELLNKYFEVR